MIETVMDLNKAIHRAERLQSHVLQRTRIGERIGTKGTQVYVDVTQDPTITTDADLIKLGRIANVRERISNDIRNTQNEINTLEISIANYAPTYAENLKQRQEQLNKLQAAYTKGFLSDAEFGLAQASFENYASLPTRSTALQRGIALLEEQNKKASTEAQSDPSKKEGKIQTDRLDRDRRQVSINGTVHQIRSDSLWRLIQVMVENGGKISSQELQDLVVKEKLSGRKRSPGSGLISKLRNNLGDNFILSERNADEKLPLYSINPEYLGILMDLTQDTVAQKVDSEEKDESSLENIQEHTVQDETSSDELRIVVNPNSRDFQIGGKKVRVASDSRWHIFNQIVNSTNGLTSSELNQILADNNVTNTDGYQGTRVISGIRESLTLIGLGHLMKSEKIDSRTRRYWINAPVEFLPLSAPEQSTDSATQIEEIQREIDTPFIDAFSKGNIAMIASTCFTNREQINAILESKNLNLISDEQLKTLTYIIGDETLLPITQLPMNKANKLISEARREAFVKVIELFQSDNLVDRLNEIGEQNEEVWQLLVNLSELSDIISTESDQTTEDEHPLIQAFCDVSRTIIFNKDNKGQIPHEIRFKAGVTLESIVQRIQKAKSSR